MSATFLSLSLSTYTYSVQVIQTSFYTHGHLSPVCWGFWARVHCSSEAFTDFLYSHLQVISLKEYDEY